MIVTFNPSSDFNYTENQNINITIDWNLVLTPEELLEEPVNGIVSKTVSISPNTSNIAITSNPSNFNITGTFSLDDFNAEIYYVDKDKSDKTQTPVKISKYSLVPNNKDVFKIIPIETSKLFVLTVELKDKNNVLYNKTYNINIKINNTSISNWIKNYFQERY